MDESLRPTRPDDRLDVVERPPRATTSDVIA